MIKDIPQIGLGTWMIEDKKILKGSIEAAIKAGYKHIDTAQVYDNEYQIGEVLKELKIDREELFITSKVAPVNYKNFVVKSTEETLRRLQIEKIDLMLLHAASTDELNEIAYKELMKARDKGLVRLIGVSNFSIEKLEALKKVTGEYPYCNQIVLSPLQRVKKLEDFCKAKKIKLTGYSIMRPYFEPNPFISKNALSDDQKSTIDSIAKAYNKDVGQILNRWALQIGYNIIPKSSNPKRVTSNIDILNFELTKEEISIITSFNALDEKGYADLIEEWGSSITDEAIEKGLLFDKNFKEGKK